MGRTEQTRIQKVVLDAGPIIHLEEIDCLNLLLDFNELLVPAVVWREVEYHRPSAFNKTFPFKKIPFMQNKNIQVSMICGSLDLDAGETQAIELCFLDQSAVLLTDDAAARLAANSLRIRAYGTIGVLLRAIRRNLLAPAEVIKILENLPSKSTLFIRQGLLQEIIEEVRSTFGSQE